MLARAACFVVALYALPAAAQTAIFTERWEAGTTRWHAIDANPIVVTSDSAPSCSTSFQRETVPTAGGRVFTNGTGAAQIPVMAGASYCLSAWIRASTGAGPFLGFYLDDGSGAGAGQRHWMIGDATQANDYGGMAVQVTADDVWRWYKAPFTAEPGAVFIVLTDEVLMSGSADFDDIQVWSGGCPAAAPGVDAHAVCGGTTAICDSSGACVECVSGQTGACSAGGKGSICLPSESCGCTADAHCGSTTSGRICNTTTNLCAAGCRGPGGNGCPPGMVCSSTDSNPGTCGVAPDLSGADMTMPADLSTPPDLQGAGDLAAPPDLASADDLAAPVDMGRITGVAGGGGCGCTVGGRSDGDTTTALIAMMALFGLAITLQQLRRRARR